MGAGSGGDLGTGQNDGGLTALSQGDIAAILDTLNTGEIMEAQTAQSRGLTVAAVNDFAMTMITAHGMAKTREDQLFVQLGITPTPNDVTAMLMMSSSHIIAVLNGLSGRALDEGYVDSQVAAHQDALDKIDYLLMPNATSSALQNELTTIRATVAMHLEMAQALQTQLVGLDP